MAEAAQSTVEHAEDHQFDVVDPQIRAHIHSLCSALGGQATDDSGKYVLGDEALAVLKDLRRWLKLYDEKLNRYDVARCLSETNLLVNDLLEIITQWKDEDIHVKWKHRIALACVELIAPLTWPLLLSEETTVNHHRHLPVIEWAQMVYKRGMLQHRTGRALRDIIRVALPSMAIPSLERTERDEGIIRLVLFIMRNVAMIEEKNVDVDAAMFEDIDRSATIKAFEEQNVFDLLLTVSSGAQDDFRNHETTVMETLYHLVKGVEVESVFSTDSAQQQTSGKDLTSLLKKEDQMKRLSSRQPTRHNRFGTTVWIEREDGSRSFVPGQKALLDKQAGLQKLDSTKKFRRLRGGDKKGVSHNSELDHRITLDPGARRILKSFAEKFIDAGFNPLFIAMRRQIDRDIDRLLVTQTKQFFYVVSWFLHAERVRRAELLKQKNTVTDSFAVIAGVLNHEFLITLNKSMTEWLSLQLWKPLQAAMRCFTQIMYTVQDMTQSPDDDDQEIAENIQNRLFYEEATLQLMPDCVKAYTRQPFSWLDDCTEMAHVHLKMLEKYSQQHEHMYVRAKKRQSKKKKQQALIAGEEPEAEQAEDELEEEGREMTRERAFEFQKFEGKYLNQKCIDTFLAYLRFYRELSPQQLMRVLKFLHRVAEKRKMEVFLFRVDIVDLIFQVVRGPEALPRSSPIYKHFDQFARHFLRRLFKKIEKEPITYVELLFSKLPSTLHYLQFGNTKDYRVSKPIYGIDLEHKPGLTPSEQLGVCVAALVDDKTTEVLHWLKPTLRHAITERTTTASFAAAAAADPSLTPPPPPEPISLIPPNDNLKQELHNNPKVRLLMTTLGFSRLHVLRSTIDTPWTIPEDTTAEQLQDKLSELEGFLAEPPSYPDGQTAEDYLRRVQHKIRPPPARKTHTRPTFDSDESSADDEDFIVDPRFAPDDTLNTAPQKRKKKTADDTEKPKRTRAPIDPEKAAERRRERRRKEIEKLKGIKSEAYIVDSDDGIDDDEFFRREREIRERGPRPIEEIETEAAGATRKRKRGRKVRTPTPAGSSEDESEAPREVGEEEDSERDAMDEEEDGPAKVGRSSPLGGAEEEDEEDEDGPVVRRPRKRAMVLDSDEE